MAQCEDFPCCGHENGCCPDYDESGKQTNMVCTCGAKLPVDNRSSLCAACLYDMEGNDEDCGFFDDDEPDVDELTEHQDFERADEYYGPEDYGDFGYDGCHEE